MTKIYLSCQGASARVKVTGTLTAGAVGIPVEVELDESFTGLAVYLTASCGGVKKAMVLSQGGSSVPHECLIAGQSLMIGIDGVTADGTLRIPTIWANCGMVYPSAAELSPSPPTPELAAQVLIKAENAETLAQQASRYAAELREAYTSGAMDGFSPKVFVNPQEWGTNVVIMDRDGAHGFDVKDGKNYDDTQLRQSLEAVGNRVTELEQGGIGGGGYVTPEMYGALGNGSGDDTVPFQEAVNSGKPVRLTKGKTYRIGGAVFTKDVELDGCGATVIASGLTFYGADSVEDTFHDYGRIVFRTDADFLRQNRLKVTIKNLTIRQSSHVAQMLMLNYVDGAKIENCTFLGDAFRDGVFRETGATQAVSIEGGRNVVLEGCTIEGFQSYGMFANHSEHVTLRDCTFSWTGRGGAYARSGNEWFSVLGCRFLNTMKHFTVDDAPIDIYGEDCKHIRIEDNYICGFGSETQNGNGINLMGSSDIIVRNNVVATDENTYGGSLIYITCRYDYPSADVIVEGNQLIAKEGKLLFAIRTHGSGTGMKNLVIRNNSILAATQGTNGVHIRMDMDGCLIDGNDIDASTHWAALVVEDSGYAVRDIAVTNNRIRGMVVLNSAKNVSFTGNHVIDNADPHYTDEDGNAQVKNYAASVQVANAEEAVVMGNIITAPHKAKTIGVSGVKELRMEHNVEYTEEGYKEVIPLIVYRKQFPGGECTVGDIMEHSVSHVKVFGKSRQNGVPAPDNLVPFDSYRGNLTVNGMVLPDSVVKHAIPVTDNHDRYNMTDAEGNRWLADYRDWEAGVDWHYTHVYEFDGQETFETYYNESLDATRVTIRGGTLESDELASIGSDYTRSHIPFLNFAPNPGASYGFNSINAAGTGFGWYGMFTYWDSLEAFTAWLRQKHGEGNPAKVLYALHTPYATPIPENELAAYRAMQADSGTELRAEPRTTMELIAMRRDDQANAIADWTKRMLKDTVAEIADTIGTLIGG